MLLIARPDSYQTLALFTYIIKHCYGCAGSVDIMVSGRMTSFGWIHFHRLVPAPNLPYGSNILYNEFYKQQVKCRNVYRMHKIYSRTKLQDCNFFPIVRRGLSLSARGPVWLTVKYRNADGQSLESGAVSVATATRNNVNTVSRSVIMGREGTRLLRQLTTTDRSLMSDKISGRRRRGDASVGWWCWVCWCWWGDVQLTRPCTAAAAAHRLHHWCQRIKISADVAC